MQLLTLSIILVVAVLVTAQDHHHGGHHHIHEEQHHDDHHHKDNHHEEHHHEEHHHPKYHFDYGVKDTHTGDHKSQWESRDGDKVKGEFTFHEPDGTKRVVEYHADKHGGFQPIVKRIGHAHHPQNYHHHDDHKGHDHKGHDEHKGEATSYQNHNQYYHHHH